MRHGRHSRRHRNPHRHDRPNGPQPQQGPRGPRDPRQAPIPTSGPTIPVAGVVDIAEGSGGFLRLAAQNYLPLRDDVVVPGSIARDYALRDGTEIEGVARDAGGGRRVLVEVHKASGLTPEEYRALPHFQDLVSVNPSDVFQLSGEQSETSLRVIDLIAPIGKGQRGLIVSPPKAGKTTVMKQIVRAIEANNPEVHLFVLLVDERPEEVTDMKRWLKNEGSTVVASTFDRPSDEHIHVAELTIERAKRLVEQGGDVVIILDGITRLSRAYNLAAPQSGRVMTGGIDTSALYPPKKFFGAARNVEEGGSLTILATALVETGSRMDEVIFEEFKGTGNMELRLDRKLAEQRIYPAIDVDASSTRHEELLYDRKQLQMVWKLRRVLSGLAADGNAAPGLELLVDRLRTFRTNDEFLAEISKQPGM